MKWQQLSAIVWLRWRMSLNQMRRGGFVSAIIMAFLGVSLGVASIGLFFVGLLVGVAVLPRLSPENIMLLWDVVAVVLLFFWTMGLVTELQRSEVLSLQKLLHLPVSPSGTFVMNYLGSLASLSLAVLLPGMVGLGIALVVTKGPAAFMIFPLIGGFVLMVTALTHQFQGWLAALMQNKRRRRTVIAFVTIAFIFVSQLPNLLTNVLSRGGGHGDELRTVRREQIARLDDARAKGTISAEEHSARSEATWREYRQRVKEREDARLARLTSIAATVNAIVPPGWLPYGAMGCARGGILPAVLGALGMTLIGAASLGRSYRTTLRLYTGHYTSGRTRATPLPAPTRLAPVGAGFLERDIPGLSEQAAAVALANLRSLMRAPEAKMVLLTPVILAFVFGSMLLTGRMRPPIVMRPFMGLAGIGIALLSLQQLVGNQFGLDRGGFRAYVLSPLSRRDILLGKNLSFAPVALGLGILLLVLVQVFYPMRVDHFLGTVVETGSSYLIFCVVANLTSILAPAPLAAGTLKPAHAKASVVLMNLLSLPLLPILIALAVLPLGLELVCHYLGWLRGVPIYLICALPELAVVAWLYGQAIRWQGGLLHAREQRIMEVVTSKVE
jgi:ABC-2 type transport system permease protein